MKNHYSNIYGNFIHNNKTWKQNVANRMDKQIVIFFLKHNKNQKNKKLILILTLMNLKTILSRTQMSTYCDSIYKSVTAKKEDYI